MTSAKVRRNVGHGPLLQTPQKCKEKFQPGPTTMYLYMIRLSWRVAATPHHQRPLPPQVVAWIIGSHQSVLFLGLRATAVLLSSPLQACWQPFVHRKSKLWRRRGVRGGQSCCASESSEVDTARKSSQISPAPSGHRAVVMRI